MALKQDKPQTRSTDNETPIYRLLPVQSNRRHDLYPRQQESYHSSAAVDESLSKEATSQDDKIHRPVRMETVTN
ncbi:hypothetical protein vBPaerPs12_119 [Pseudomonas phage vB_Paer_Ps12]|uniref:Uncharacterized protein n=1 Tax=Pseudomonas phage vB_Paer_Ps12 TaxID=2924904 RepID=A0AAE9GN79_9CAUD|nr:hypothetical protein QE347_gp119 [Pseudomonas phage vB_Paer_Ps12]UOL47575.1 hypothetical protein vBPaerPs12_119 [Pseudomonas phage vB_Paer_Ps12]